jgi:ABC-type multidrug transport system fused ATPase/permease subunit
MNEQGKKARTVCFISHRFHTVKRADRIAVVDHGTVKEEGTHEQLMAIAGGVYREFYTLQAEAFAG